MHRGRDTVALPRASPLPLNCRSYRQTWGHRERWVRGAIVGTLLLPFQPCDTAQHGTAQHGTAQHSIAWHSIAWHSTAQHGTAWHSTAWHGTARHSAHRLQKKHDAGQEKRGNLALQQQQTCGQSRVS